MNAETDGARGVVVTSVDGGIAMCWDVGARHSYVEVERDSIVLAMWEGMGEPFVAEVAPADLFDSLVRARDYVSGKGAERG